MWMGRMKRNISFQHDYAVTEIVGTILLIIVAVISFSAIYLYLFPPPPDIATPVTILAGVDQEGIVTLEHKGGDTLENYEIITRYYPNATYIGSKEYEDDNWHIGQIRYPLDGISSIRLTNETTQLWIMVINIKRDGSQEAIYDGILTGKTQGTILTPTYGEVMLISNLRTDSSDEDLICFNDTINSSINPLTYIYKWLVNGNPIAELIMPFDTNNSNITKDYSGNGNDGEVRDCQWTTDGVVGGAYGYGGSKEFISVELDLPICFYEIDSTDFTLCIWEKSTYAEDDQKILLEGRKDTQNFVRLFQEEGAIYFGVCENNNKYSVKTADVISNVWYHIAIVWDASEKNLTVYLNGTSSTERGNKSFSCGAQEGLSLGHGTSGSGGYWFGYLDELTIYNRVLSEEQIYQIYLDQKDGQSDKRVIVAEETSLGQIWQCIVTPNNSIQDDTPVISNTLQITSYLGGE